MCNTIYVYTLNTSTKIQKAVQQGKDMYYIFKYDACEMITTAQILVMIAMVSKWEYIAVNKEPQQEQIGKFA